MTTIETLFLYSIKSAFVLALLYVPYMLMLSRESFFRLNRAVLLLIMLLSLVLPLMDVSMLAWDNQPVVQVARTQMIEVGIPIAGGSPAADTLASEAARMPRLSWFHLLALVSITGSIGMLVWKAVQIVQINRMLLKGCLWHQQEDGVHIYCHAQDVSPFSWMNSIVISEKDYRENAREILLHERGHIRARHSWDLLFLSLVQTLQWWNPLAHILGGSLRDVHEYEADDHVLNQGVSARQYQLLLIKKVVGTSSYTFANNFNHSLTLKRITMMQKSKSSVWMRSKVLYIIPVATLALSAFATSQPTVPADQEAIRIEDKVTEKNPSQQADARQKVNIVSNPAVPAQFKGGQEAMMKFLQSNVKYPKKAQEQGVMGRVIVELIISEKGEVSSAKAISVGKNAPTENQSLSEVVVSAYAKECAKAGKELSAEELAAYGEGVLAMMLEAVRVVKAMPAWEPGYVDAQKTQPCATRFVLPIVFRLG